MADLAFSHPELARRYELLVERCWQRAWDVSISSSSRSEATQRAWYALYLKGQWIVDGKPAIVADPDRDAGATPFGWRAHGSLHMIQQDNYSHALDLGITGPTHEDFQALAWTCGLGHPEPSEWWHFQAFDAYSNGFYPVEEDDMTPEQLGLIKDPNNPGNPVYGLMLMETVPDAAHPEGTFKWYPYNEWAIFTHQAGKMYFEKHP